MTEETIGPSTYEIIQKPENKKWYVCIGGKECGPWDEASKLTFTFDWRSWVSTVKAGGKWYMLIDGVEHGKKESYFFDITSFYGKFSPEIDHLVKTVAR